MNPTKEKTKFPRSNKQRKTNQSQINNNNPYFPKKYRSSSFTESNESKYQQVPSYPSSQNPNPFDSHPSPRKKKIQQAPSHPSSQNPKPFNNHPSPRKKKFQQAPIHPSSQNPKPFNNHPSPRKKNFNKLQVIHQAKILIL